MNTTILCPLTPGQVKAMIEWHTQEVAYFSGPQYQASFWVQKRDEHLRIAADLRRRLIAAQDRTETNT